MKLVFYIYLYSTQANLYKDKSLKSQSIILDSNSLFYLSTLYLPLFPFSSPFPSYFFEKGLIMERRPLPPPDDLVSASDDDDSFVDEDE